MYKSIKKLDPWLLDAFVDDGINWEGPTGTLQPNSGQLKFSFNPTDCAIDLY